MGKIESLIVDELNSLDNKINVSINDKQDGMTINLPSGLSVRLTALSSHVMRVRFLDSYYFDTIIDDFSNRNEVDFVVNQVRRLVEALIRESFQEFDLKVRSGQCIGQEVKIEFDPLDEQKFSTFKTKIRAFDRLKGLVCGVNTIPTLRQKTELEPKD